MTPEFEEKQYEQHLNMQLVEDHRLVYPPGQVLESDIGIDSALYVEQANLFWQMVRSPHRNGVKINAQWWDELAKKIDLFPPFRYNVFLQHKRPKYLKRPNAKEWDSWGDSYFRYSIRSKQQKALTHLENKVGPEGVVYHASPAFHRRSELWDAISKSQVVERSNFAQPSQTDGHSVYTYNKPGSSGIGFSEPKEVESTPLRASIEELSVVDIIDDNQEFLIRLGNQVQAATASSDEEFQILHNQIVESLQPDESVNDLAVALTRIDAFRFLTHSTLLIGIG